MLSELVEFGRWLLLGEDLEDVGGHVSEYFLNGRYVFLEKQTLE